MESFQVNFSSYIMTFFVILVNIKKTDIELAGILTTKYLIL